MQKKVSIPVFIGILLLLTGNIIGAGILGVPIQTGLAGFFPSLIGMLFITAVMLFTSLVLSNEATRTHEENFHYPSLYQKYLGNIGKWAAIAAYLIIFYGTLTAYLSGITTIVIELFHPPLSTTWILIIFGVTMSALAMTNMEILRRYNAVLVVLMLAAFVMLITMSEKLVEPNRLLHQDWSFLPSTVPIIIMSLNFYNIIPLICKDLKWNADATWKTIVIGLFIGYVLNAIWMQISLGSLPLGGDEISISTALQNNYPATVPLAEKVNSPMFTSYSLIFAVLAIMTSFLSNGKGLMGFVDDLLINHLKFSKKSNIFVSALISFGPPLLISILYPNIFLQALDIVGGIGLVILFGILPCLIAILRPNKTFKILGVIVLIVFCFFLLLELGHELGFLKLGPKVEYWKYNFTHK
ncbi:MAG: aromatic amino acid transport family protein [Candidatus Omnitrophota bacterium]|nr:hypothetical protein [Candidatus Omnitrophota bacterium]